MDPFCRDWYRFWCSLLCVYVGTSVFYATLRSVYNMIKLSWLWIFYASRQYFVCVIILTLLWYQRTHDQPSMSIDTFWCQNIFLQNHFTLETRPIILGRLSTVELWHAFFRLVATQSGSTNFSARYPSVMIRNFLIVIFCWGINYRKAHGAVWADMIESQTKANNFIPNIQSVSDIYMFDDRESK